MATVQAPASGSLVLDNVDWPMYSRLLRLFEDRPGVRLTYDRGVLEIMTLSPQHERRKHLLRRLLEALAEEMGIAIAGFGSMTCRRRRNRRGLEPDECYWIANEPAVRGRDNINLRVDPPPDLALEVNWTRSSLDRMAIYARLGVAEVWRLEADGLHFHVLQTDGTYALAVRSLSFPIVAPADILGFLALHGTTDEGSIVRQFRVWVKQQVARGQTP